MFGKKIVKKQTVENGGIITEWNPVCSGRHISVVQAGYCMSVTNTTQRHPHNGSGCLHKHTIPELIEDILWTEYSTPEFVWRPFVRHRLQQTVHH